ncbi:MAG: transglycosylase SLT domain-containing protein [Candidatus Gracilibacteria bacterium]
MSDSIAPEEKNPVEAPVDLAGNLRSKVEATASDLILGGVAGDVFAVSAVVSATMKRIIPDDTADKEGDVDVPAGVDVVNDQEEDTESKEPVRSAPVYSEVGAIISRGKYTHELETGGIQSRFIELFRKIFETKGDYAFYFDKYGELLLQVEFSQKLKDNRAKAKLLAGEILQNRRLLSRLKGKRERSALNSKITELERKLRALRLGNERETQDWHNKNRQRCHKDGEIVIPENYKDLGYPFVATTGPSDKEADENPGLTIDEIVLNRLDEMVSSGSKKPIYFDGKEKRLYDAIVEIATAYDVPRAIVLGIPANESMFRKEAESEAEAKGIYQITNSAFIDGKKYIAAHPGFGKNLRNGLIGTYEESWPNRFVSTELFCAYYRSIKEGLKNPILELEERIKKLDPSLPSGTFDDLVTITAYNAGADRMKKCLARFIALSDEDIKKLIGEPQYGADVCIGLVAYSFGMQINKKLSTGVGADVFMYVQKAIAMGLIIRDEETIVEGFNRDKSGFVAEPKADEVKENGPVEDDAPDRRGLFRKLTGLLTTVATVMAGADVALRRKHMYETGPDVDHTAQALSRRDLLRGLLAVGAMASLPFSSGASSSEPETETKTKNHESGDAVDAKYIYEQTLEQGRIKLDLIYADLKKRIKSRESGGIMDYTPNEIDDLRRYLMPQQTALLRGRFKDMLGEELEAKFERMTTSQIDREVRKNPDGNNMLSLAQEKQKGYMADQIKKGEVIRLSADDPKKPYFCEQIGKSAGLENNPDNMFISKEMEKIMGTLVMLVNHQIDIFNGDKTAYGIMDKNFPDLPNISAIRVTGALRTPLQSLGFLRGKSPLPATLDLSSHWVAHAIDMGSKKSANGNMVRLANDLVDPLSGLQVKAGEKLSNGGYGKRIREMYSHMIGRALFAMEDPLKADGVVLQPLWEQKQGNWHLAWNAK